MNKFCYRIIFNKVRGMLMVVPDIARSGYGRVARRRQRSTRSEAQVRLSPLCYALWLAAGVISLPVQANVVADSSAPGNQQPTVLSTANGLPQINIQTPNSRGVSRNQYTQLDVDARGAILNNSHQNTQTQLGGMVAANPWLSKQEASVILNEVNSRNPSQLNGFIEVAGKRAAVVIANPAGITCNGCGFINASRNTLTTGQAIMENGQLKGFDVNGGRINIEGKGLNDTDADYTQIVAQSVAVNAKLHARELNVVTGRNQVSAEGSVTTVKAGDAATQPAFALDVAALGGMYANKITLTGTEKGVGVRNAGELGASAGQLRLSVDGKLENSGTLQSDDALQIASQGDQNNSGKIVSKQDVTLSSEGALHNSGLISARGNTTLGAGRIESSGGSTLAAGVDDSGAVTQPGNLLLTSQGELKAQGKNLAHNQIQARGSRVDISGSQTAADDIALTATQDDISLSGATVTGKNVHVQAATQFNNDDGKLSAGSLAVAAQSISNNRGLLRQQNREALTLDSDLLLNNQGTIVNEGDTHLTAQRIENRSGLIAGNGQTLTLDTRQLENQQGKIQLAGDGALTLNATQLEGNQGSLLSAGTLVLTGKRLDLSQAETQAQAVTVTADTLNHQQGLLSQRGAGEMVLSLSDTADNQDGRIESGGNLRLTSGTLNNSRGTLLGSQIVVDTQQGELRNDSGNLVAQGNLSVSGGAVENSAGLIQSGQNLTIDTHGQTLTNTDSGQTGGVISGGELTLNSGDVDNSAGVLVSTGKLLLNSGALDNSDGILASDRTLTLTTDAVENQRGLLQAGDILSLDTQGATLTNTDSGETGGIVSAGDLHLDTGLLNNRAGKIESAQNLLLDTHGNALTNTDSGNSHGIVAMNDLDLRSAGINNQSGFIAAGSLATLQASELNNSQGQLAGNGGVTFRGQAIDNSDGKLQSAGDITLDTAEQTLNNQRGLIAGSAKTRIDSGLLENQRGQIQSGTDLTLDLGQNTLQNQGGKLFSAGTLTLTAGQLANQAGRLQSVKEARLVLTQQLDNSDGLIQGGQGLDITTPRLINRDTRQNGNGIEADTLTLQTDTLDNSQGALRATIRLALTARQALENLNGLISSGNALIVQDAAQGQTLAIDNRQGTIIADKEAQISAASLSGDGQLLSQGDLGITLAGDFHNLADVKANGTLQLTSGGNITNEGAITAQQALWLRAQNLNNQSTGEISAQETHVAAGDTLNNTGLIDGALTHLVANVLNNSGTGRIYGDHLAIAAAVLNNFSENGKAAVIAARDRLDLAADTVNNREHALIYSVGDMHIGGQLDSNYQASGQGRQLNNDGATIEAGRDADIAMAGVNNTNSHLVTETVMTENAQHHDAVLKGHTDRFDWSEVDTSHKNKYKVHTAKMPDGTSGSEFYEYTYQRVVNETQVKESDPGKILSGGNMTFTAGRLYNHDSQIVAGATLGGQIGELDNQATKGTRVTTDKGKSVRWYAKKKKKKLGGTKTSQGKSSSDYRPASVTETIDLKTFAWQANAAPQGNGYQTGSRQQRSVTAQASAVSAVNGQQATTAVALGAINDGTLTLDKLDGLKDHPLVLPAGQQLSLTLPATVVDGQSITPVIRAVSPDTHLPDNSLFTLQPASDSHYLVETDPRFVNQKQWLSSDYMQNALPSDGSQMLKRLGDGFYEQRLVRDQITQLTGSRYISGYSNDEDQYRGLMNDGIAFGKTYQLSLGVALTPAQMALLTSDIVWLVNQTVTLPDGTQQTVLVPQVYAKVKEGDLTGDGALLGGGSVALNAQKDITNSGTIHGREVTQLTAQSLTNSGYIDGNQVNLAARQDITNTGGTISGQKQVSLLAGRDITSQATLRGEGADRWIDRPAGIYVQADDGAMTLSALNNITLAASDIGNAGENGTTLIQAGNDLTLGTVATQHSENDSWGGDNYRHLSTQTDVGTRITTAGDLQLSAGQDLKASAADVTAGGALSASAGRDMTLTTGESRTDLTEHSKQSSKGLLSGSSLETHDEVHDDQGVSTTFSGDSVTLQAGRDINVTGSNVAGTQDVALAAGRDLTITTAAESREENHQREEKKSGLMGTGGIGFTVGQAQQKSTTDATGALNKGSTIGSSDGSVTLSANNQLVVHGSDVIAGKDLTLSGSDVTITAAENSHTALTRTEQRQSGLTLALSGAMGAALNTAVQVAHTAQETGDGRLKALQATKATLYATQAEQAYEMDGAKTASAAAKNKAAGLKEGDDKAEKGATDTIGVNLSYGSQSSKSETRTESREAQGSTLGAGGNVQITATGQHADSLGDIFVQGSQLKAGGDMALAAKNDISLFSAQNSERTDSKNSSRGGSVGVGITAGSGGYGISVSASVNAGKGHSNGNGVTHTESMLEAGNALSLNAGRDTTLTGAQVRGDSVKLDTSRNLTLTSEQDSDRYDSKQQSASAGGSFNIGSMTGSASVNLSQDKMHSNWQSVSEQSGIFAGKGGFDVSVGEHTQLNGAVIASTAEAEKNRLDTGTLGFSDIENRADYKVEHQSVGMSTGGAIGSQFEGNMATNALAGLNGSGSADSTTKSAVSAGTITIRDKASQQQDVATLSRDTESANPGLDKIFDKEKEQRRLDTAQLIAEIGSQAMDIARTEGQIAGEKAKNDPAALQAAREQLTASGKPFTDEDVAEQAYNTAMAPYGTGSALQQGMQAATAAIQGLVGGNVGAAISGAAAPYLAEQIHVLTEGNPEAKAMAHAVVGAVASYASGNSALAGAAGAVSGELMAGLVMKQLYPGREVSELTETEKQTISALGTLAAGLAGGVVGDSTGNAVAGAQAGKNAVENNYLSSKQIDAWSAEMKQCKAGGGDCSGIIKRYEELSTAQQKQLISDCATSPATCQQKYGDVLADSMNVKQALDKALGEDIPIKMVYDLTATWAHQMDADGIVASNKVSEQIMAKYGLDQAQADIIAGVALSALGGVSKAGKGSGSSANSTAKLSINQGQQNKHVPGTNEYKIASEAGLNKSVLTVKPDSLLSKLGTGQQVGNTAIGTPGSKERINYGKVIGNYIDPQTGVSTPTTNGIIHYGKNGVHIVPARPSE